MPRFNVYDTILQGEDATEENALLVAAEYDWGSIDLMLQDIKYAEHIETVNGIGVYYDYGADYYFFTDDEEDIH